MNFWYLIIEIEICIPWLWSPNNCEGLWHISFKQHAGQRVAQLLHGDGAMQAGDESKPDFMLLNRELNFLLHRKSTNVYDESLRSFCVYSMSKKRKIMFDTLSQFVEAGTPDTPPQNGVTPTALPYPQYVGVDRKLTYHGIMTHRVLVCPCRTFAILNISIVIIFSSWK